MNTNSPQARRRKGIGFVYILANKAMPGIYKVGMTYRDPAHRARQLSQPSGVALPFEVFGFGECEDALDVEQDIHAIFDENRVSSRREFFALDEHDLWCLIEALYDTCDNVSLCEYAQQLRLAARARMLSDGPSNETLRKH